MELSVRRYTWTVLGMALLVMSGARLVKSVKFDYVLSMDITNRVCSNDLLDSSSADYQMLHAQVSGALYSIYGCFTCVPRSFNQGVSNVNFSNKGGSVVVKAMLVFSSTQINAAVIKGLFNKVVSGSNEINGLKIDPAFTQVNLQTTHAPSTTPRPSTTSSPMSTSHTTTTSRTMTTSHPNHKHEESNNATSVFHQNPVTLASFLISMLLFRLIL